MNRSGKYNVLHVIRQGLIGGGESHLLTLIQKLDKEQVASHVLSFTDGPMVSKLRELQIPVQVIAIPSTFDLTLLIKVKRLISAWGIDLLHAHGTRACINMLIPAKLLKMKLVYTIHGWSFHNDQSPIVKFIRKTAEKILVSLVQQNICVSQANYQTGLDLVSTFNAQVIQNGIDLNRFNPVNAYKDFRKEWKIPENAIVVLFAARMTLQKQPLIMLKAFDQAAAHQPNLYLVMAGEGDLSGDVEKTVNELFHKERVRLLPFYDDMPAVLSSVDIFALPSLWEGLPMSLIEAMAMGKAIIATDVDGTQELIQSGLNGMLVRVTVSLEKELAQGLIDLAINPALRLKMGEEAIKTVARDFNAATMAAKTMLVYQQACSNN